MSGQQLYDPSPRTPGQPTAPRARAIPAPVEPAWYRRTPFVGVAAAVAGLVVGVVGAATLAGDPSSSAQYQALQQQQSDTSTRLHQAQADLASAQSDLQRARGRLGNVQDRMTRLIGDLPVREAAVKKAEAAVARREAAVTQAEQDVAAREKAVTVTEDTIADNTVSGDGVYAVGDDIKAGTYKTAGKPGCYYAVLNSAKTSDIVDNNNVDGPAVVTVNAGQYLELSGCADWVWQQ